MNYEPFPDFTNPQPAPVFNGLNFNGMSQWGLQPMNNVDLAAPMTSGYTWQGINPNKLGPLNTVNLDGAQIYQSPISGPAGGGSRSIWSSPLQQRNADNTTSGGWLTAGLGIAQGMGNLYLGMRQYQLAKDTLAANKANSERNFNAQRTTINSQLEDRQRARVAANPGAYQSVSEYMDQNRVR